MVTRFGPRCLLALCWNRGSLIGSDFSMFASQQLNPGFATLPPHFNISNALGNEHVKKGVQILYESILTSYREKPNDPTPMLVHCFACMIYHIDSIKAMMVKCPGHDFAKLPLLHDHQLIAQLKPLVTTDPMEGIMAVATVQAFLPTLN